MSPSRLDAPWYLWLPPALAAFGVGLPLAFLLTHALSGSAETIRHTLLHSRNLLLLGNTLALTVAVLAGSGVTALALACLTVRTDLPGRKIVSVLAVLPLAVPGYLLAYTLLSVGGQMGLAARWTGMELPRLTGFWGAALALSIYNTPYMYLNLRVALQRLDPALEESSRNLGRSAWATFRSVVLPQLRPAFFAGGLIVALHVIADFGVVSLLRFETFSYALFASFEVYDLNGAAWLALMMLAVTAALLAVDFRYLKNVRLDIVGPATPRRRNPTRLGYWKPVAWVGVGLYLAAGVGIPVATILFWLGHYDPGSVFYTWSEALGNSVTTALLAAVFAVAMALPVAYLSRRRPSWISRLLERATFIGYATPSLAFGLSILLLSTWFDVLDGLRSTRWLLVYAMALHFMAEAVGPIRSSLFVATPRLEEASRMLGRGPVRTYLTVTFPLLKTGLLAAAALVFLSALKELPLTFILSPQDFPTLAKSVWDLSGEVDFAGAAPHALAILICSTMFVSLLLLRGPEARKAS
ncbi:MAG: iron ABC transporter permease [Phycisphaeraceae bacterium]|nr:iron ABC transporter permease [Phycisphaeraceae bacterium]